MSEQDEAAPMTNPYPRKQPWRPEQAIVQYTTLCMFGVTFGWLMFQFARLMVCR